MTAFGVLSGILAALWLADRVGWWRETREARRLADLIRATLGATSAGTASEVEDEIEKRFLG